MNNQEILTDAKFDAVYPKSIQKHSFIHWTPIEIIETTLDWLCLDATSHVLDIGSGAGKFCVVGAMRSQAVFTGIEKRSDLVSVAKKTADKLLVSRANFRASDITSVDFSEFTHFYYYNPFCEYIAEFDHIDPTISYDPDMFRLYEDYVIDSFSRLPIGTRVVTYCSGTFPFPDSYELRDLLYDGKLALWVKTKQ